MGADTTIGTLRLRGAGTDTPALRLRAARQLQAATLAPSGLPPAAVLVVRRLADPMPGRFDGSRFRPHPEWERAVRDELAALARAAARPDPYGRLPSDARAVLFGDEAEMVACLLADRARGEVPGHWWWRSVLPRLALPRGLATDAGRDPTTILCARPREVPAALMFLARRGQAPRVAAALTAAGAARALAALAREHSLPRDLVEPSGTPIDLVRSAPRPTAPRATADRAIAETPPVPYASPWTEWAPLGVEAGAVPPEVHCLFGVAIGLHAAPARVRTSGLVARARTWWAVVTRAGSSATPGPTADPLAGRASEPASLASKRDISAIAAASPHEPRETRREGDHVPRPIAAAVVSPAPPPRLSRRRAIQRFLDPAIQSQPPLRASGVKAAAPAPDTRAPTPEGPVRADRAGRGEASRRRPPATPSPPRRRSATERSVDRPRTGMEEVASPTSAAVIPGEGLATRLGGLFYLIHALQDLGLPDAFAERWSADVAGPWGTLDLLARGLLGPRFAEVSADPAWTALAALADWPPRRARNDLGSGAFDPPFRVPKDWPTRLRDPLDHLRWTTSGGRLWLWSAAGYLVAHRRWRGAPLVAARREAARLRLGAPVPHLEERNARAMPWALSPSAPAGCPPRLRRWAAAVAPAVHHRVALALGPRRDVVSALMVPARLHLTSSHVDVVMRAHDADPHVRGAGLDRDPGWLPSYGRVIYFHFE